MKKIINSLLSFSLVLMVACEQVPIETSQLEVTPTPACPADATAGTDATFTKLVTIGTSYVAGVQGGALYDNSQANSLAKIIAKQMECVGGTTTFNQPDINSVNGYNPTFSIPNVITLGRMVLYDADGATGTAYSASPVPAGYPGAAAVTCPSAAPAKPPLPAPYNTADLPGAFTGTKSALHNFGVPFMYLGQALTTATATPGDPLFNGLYARFASAPTMSTVLGDAITAQGSFYLVWLGMDDVLLWAAGGADGSGVTPLTSQAAFSAQYGLMMTNLLAGIPANSKVVLGNVPNITNIPYFYTVTWNQLQLSQAQVTSLEPLKTGYNGALLNLKIANIITEAEYNKRLIDFKVYAKTTATQTGVMITDEDLTDLSPYFPNELDHMAKARQATSSDLIPLSAGSVLGTCVGGNASAVQGVSYPVADKHAITSSELTTILTRTAEFNTIISSAQTSNSTRVALADVKTAYANFVTAKAAVANSVTITPNFAPPTGAFSEDGIHPNSRGYAFTANVFIDAINTKFGSKIPRASYAAYKGTDLPVNP